MIIPADYAQVNLRWTGQAAPQGAEVTLGLDVSAYPGNPAAAAAAVLSHYNSSGLAANQSSQITLSEVYVKFGPNATGPAASVLTSVPGTGAATSSPPNTSWLIVKRTLAGGRTGRGRMYWPGIPEGDVGSGGDITGSKVSDFQSDLDSFFTKLVTDDLIPVLLHGPNSPVTTPLALVEFDVQGLVATQRKRLRR